MQLDTSAKYYKTMIDGMTHNFKKAVNRASQRTDTPSNATAVRPINFLAPGTDNQQHRFTVHEIQIDGLGSPKVSSVYVNKKNMKLHVVFSYKSVKMTGKCSGGAGSGSPKQAGRVKLEASYWNASWSASVLPMIGRDHFDLSRVYTSHSQQKLTFDLKDCPASSHEKLKTALVDRLKSTIDGRLVEIMETVIMTADVTPDEPTSATSGPPSRGKRAIGDRSSARVNPITGKAPRPLKRVKRQTPCQQGEELDDYVDQLFRFGTRIVRTMEPITLPNATIELPDYNLKIFLYEGKGTRAYKFRRAKSAWVFCSNETISLGLTIEVDELRVAYKYRVISGTRLLFDGDLEAKLSPKVQAQFSQAQQEEDSEEPVQQRVDRVKVFRLGRVHVLIRGLGNLTQSLSMIINSYLNDNQEELQPTFRMVEGDAVRLVNRMLANVNVPLLSVV